MSVFFVWLQLTDYVTVRQIGVKVCAMVELCLSTIFSRFGGDIFRGYQMRGQERARVDHFGFSDTDFFSFDREYLENSKSQRYMSIRA